MSSAAIKKAVYEDLYKLPDNVIGEIIAGELIASPRPSPRHAHSTLSLGDELTGPFQKGRGGPGGWLLLVEPELHLGEHILVPDLAAWKRERLAHPPAGNGIDVAPDWVCEVISPSSTRTDRVLKMPRYSEFKVPHLWLLDPLAKTLEVFKLDGGSWRLLSAHSENDKVRAEPFHEIEINLAELWWE